MYLQKEISRGMGSRIRIRTKMSWIRNTATNLEESARPVGLCDGFLREGDPADGLRVAGPLSHLAEGERCPTLLHLLFLLVPHNLNQIAHSRSVMQTWLCCVFLPRQ